VSEKRQIVELTLVSGASVAEVAQAHGVNANQVFKWRRAFERGELNEPCSALLPVTVDSVIEPASVPSRDEQEATATNGAIHIELASRAMITVESGADPELDHLCWRACASDPTPDWHEDLDCRRRDRHAPWFRWPEWAGADGAAPTAVLWTCVRVPGKARRHREVSVVGRRRPLPVSEAIGARALHLAEGREWNRAAQSSPALDASRRHRLAQSRAHLGTGSHSLMTMQFPLYLCMLC